VNAIASPVLAPDTCETLRAEAFVALKSLPRRGAEIGGFLTKSANSAEDLSADGVEFVACEHLFGPSYHLSPSDLDLFRQRVASSAYKPVGYFRSCTRLEMRPEPEDLDVLHRALPGVNFVVLLRPFPNGNAAFRIFAGESLDPVSEFEVIMSFAPVPEALEPEAPEPQEPEPQEIAAPRRLDRRESAGPSLSETVREEPPAVAAPGVTSRWGVSLFVAAVILLASIFAVVVATWRRDPQPAPASAPSPSSLDLRVDRQKENFRVTWNRNLPALAKATGTLTIDDGRQPRDLQLDAAQMAGGSVVYVSDAGDLTFRMRIKGDAGHQLTESVRIVVDVRPAPAEHVTPPVAPVAARNNEESMTPEIHSWASAVPRVPTYRPANPLRKTRPEIPASLVRKGSSIEVIVRVDPTGRVSEAHAVGPSGTVPDNLATQEVLDASRRWTFTPARLHGRGVASDYTIVYSFSPQ
jgi:hypothetical protein